NPSVGQRSFQRRELLLCTLPALPVEALLQDVDKRRKGGVLKKRYRSGFEPGMRMKGKLLMESLHQARLADSRLTSDQDHLSFAFDCPLPAIYQETQFVSPPDKGGHSARGCRREPAALSAGPDDSIEWHWVGYAFQNLCAAFLD